MSWINALDGLAGGMREPAEELRPDPIVMGTHGQSGLEEPPLGSLTERLLSETRCG